MLILLKGQAYSDLKRKKEKDRERKGKSLKNWLFFRCASQAIETYAQDKDIAKVEIMTNHYEFRASLTTQW